MKKFLLSMAVLGFANVASATSPVYYPSLNYLGGAFNNGDCGVRARLNGYDQFAFGPAYDANGVYYPYWNACFGVGTPGNNNGGNGGNSAKWYSVWVGGNYSLSDCKKQINDAVAGVICFENSTWPKLECEMTPGKRAHVSDVACVKEINGPFDHPQS